MIDIENKILQIFKKNNIPNSKIFVEVKPEGLMIVGTETKFFEFDDIKQCDADLQEETYFSIKVIDHFEDYVMFQIQFDYELAACNIDCACYCSGTCPFHKKMECGRVRSKIDELKAYARVTCDKEVIV